MTLITVYIIIQIELNADINRGSKMFHDPSIKLHFRGEETHVTTLKCKHKPNAFQITFKNHLLTSQIWIALKHVAFKENRCPIKKSG